MFARLLFESFRRQVRRKAFAVLAITLGMSITTAMVSVATDIGDKINHELRSGSANLVVTPLADTLDVNIGGVDLKLVVGRFVLVRTKEQLEDIVEPSPPVMLDDIGEQIVIFQVGEEIKMRAVP